jgi:hypothetical protein
VVLVRADILKKISPPSSGVLRVIRFHSCVTVESLLISLSIERHYVGSKNSIFWDVFMVVSMIDIIWGWR